jgi:hypothetical protein
VKIIALEEGFLTRSVLKLFADDASPDEYIAEAHPIVR